MEEFGLISKSIDQGLPGTHLVLRARKSKARPLDRDPLNAGPGVRSFLYMDYLT